MARTVSFDFTFQPRAWQKKCYEEQKRFTVLSLHRRAGKTWFCLSELITYALQKPGNYVYICPQFNQATFNAWKPLKQLLNDNLIVHGGGRNFHAFTCYESSKSVHFFNGSEIKLLGADNPDSLRGSKLAGAVLDEVAQMPPELWGEIVRPALADSHGWAVFIGTPKGTDLFSELLDRGDDPRFPDWITKEFTCYQTDALSKEEIASMKQEMTPAQFAREMLCKRDVVGDDQFIAPNVVAEAMARKYAEGTFDGHKLIMGVDVARYGDDNSVIFLRRGKIVYPPIKYHGLSLVELAEHVMTIARENNVEIINIDGTGVGGGLVDILRDYGFRGVYDINFGHKSTNPLCNNKRTEMYLALRTWLEQGGALPYDNQLKKEITAPTYEKDDNGHYQLETKKKIRTRLGFSPDLADALALTFNAYIQETSPKPRDDFEMPELRRTSPHERFEAQVRNRRKAPYFAMARSSVRGRFGW